MRIGYGYDVHRLTEGRALILGGIEIPQSKGLLGHSDADVVIHAIIDSVLGALARGDIGSHFPDTDAEYKDINSRVLLRKITEIMFNEKYQIGNLDVTICAEKPKLQDHILLMRQNIASDLQCQISEISIKATTEEGLGVSGEQKGIAAHSIVLLKKGI